MALNIIILDATPCVFTFGILEKPYLNIRVRSRVLQQRRNFISALKKKKNSESVHKRIVLVYIG